MLLWPDTRITFSKDKSDLIPSQLLFKMQSDEAEPEDNECKVSFSALYRASIKAS